MSYYHCKQSNCNTSINLYELCTASYWIKFSATGRIPFCRLGSFVVCAYVIGIQYATIFYRAHKSDRPYPLSSLPIPPTQHVTSTLIYGTKVLTFPLYVPCTTTLHAAPFNLLCRLVKVQKCRSVYKIHMNDGDVGSHFQVHRHIILVWGCSFISAKCVKSNLIHREMGSYGSLIISIQSTCC